MTITPYILKQSHDGPVSAVAMDGVQILTGAYDGCLARWKLIGDALEAEAFVYLHEKGINCVASAPNGRSIATGGSDGQACIVQLETSGAKVVRCLHPGDVESLAFTADSRFLLAGGTDGFARLFDVESGREILAIPHGKTVGAICRHPNPALMVTACNDRSIRLVRLSDGVIVARSQAHGGPVKALGVISAGILSSGHDNTLLLHDFALECVKKVATFSTTPKTLAVEPDGLHFWVGVYDQYTTRWAEDEAGGLFEEAVAFCSRAWAHGLAASSGIVVAGSFDGSPVVFRSGPAGLAVLQARKPVPCISAAALQSNRSLLVAGDSGTVRRLRCDASGPLRKSSTEPAVQVEGAITSIAGETDDLIIGSWDGEVARVLGGQLVWTARWPASGQRGVDRAGSPVLRVTRANGRVLAGLYTGGFACFRDIDGQPLWINREATGAVKCVALQGDVFAATGRYDPLRVGNAATGRIMARLPLATAVSDVLAFSPFAGHKPRIAVCAGANEIWIVELNMTDENWTVEIVHRSRGHNLPIKSLAWASADTVYAGDYGGCVVRHQVERLASTAFVVECRTGVSSLHVMPDGRVIWTSFDGDAGVHACMKGSYLAA